MLAARAKNSYRRHKPAQPNLDLRLRRRENPIKEPA